MPFITPLHPMAAGGLGEKRGGLVMILFHPPDFRNSGSYSGASAPPPGIIYVKRVFLHAYCVSLSLSIRRMKDGGAIITAVCKSFHWEV